MSSTYRLNSVFWMVSDPTLDWHEEIWAIADIGLTGMSLTINRALRKPEVMHDPMKLKAYLKQYFDSHPLDDPEGLVDVFR